MWHRFVELSKHSRNKTRERGEEALVQKSPWRERPSPDFQGEQRKWVQDAGPMQTVSQLQIKKRGESSEEKRVKPPSTHLIS